MEKRNVMPLREAIAEYGSVDFIIDQKDSQGVNRTFASFANGNVAAIGSKAKAALLEGKGMDNFRYQEIQGDEGNWVPVVTLKGGLTATVTFSL